MTSSDHTYISCKLLILWITDQDWWGQLTHGFDDGLFGGKEGGRERESEREGSDGVREGERDGGRE